MYQSVALSFEERIVKKLALCVRVGQYVATIEPQSTSRFWSLLGFEPTSLHGCKSRVGCFSLILYNVEAFICQPLTLRYALQVSACLCVAHPISPLSCLSLSSVVSSTTLT